MNFKIPTLLNGDVLLSNYGGDGFRFSPRKYGLTEHELNALAPVDVQKAVEEYALSAYALRRSNTSLVQYVRTAQSEFSNAPLDPDLKSACEKLQQCFGDVVKPGEELMPMK